jgi:hypothetical protein
LKPVYTGLVLFLVPFDRGVVAFIWVISHLCHWHRCGCCIEYYLYSFNFIFEFSGVYVLFDCWVQSLFLPSSHWFIDVLKRQYFHSVKALTLPLFVP